MADLTLYDYINNFYEFIDVNQISSNAKLLYYTLLVLFNKSHWETELQKTNSRVCELCGFSEKTLIKVRNELKQRGLIDFKGKTKTAVKYTLTELYTGNTPVNTSVNSSVYTSVNSSVYSSALYKSKDKRVKIKDNIIPLPPLINSYTENEELRKALNGFVDMRKGMKKPLSDRALELALGKLNTLADNDSDKIQIVNNAVMNSWLGFYPLKDKKEQTTSANPYLDMLKDLEGHE